MPSFVQKLADARRKNDSLLCVGLDPDPALMAIRDVSDFNRAIIDATRDLVCAFKPNIAFYEAMGIPGLLALENTLKAVPSHIPVIGDVKRGDIGNTATAYARAMFETWGFDAVTVHPYMGWDSIEPFARAKDKGVFVLCRTSNTGQSDFQGLMIQGEGGASRPLFEEVARRVAEWDKNANLGLVVGATHPDELRRVREICPIQPLLIPGVGAQGGDLVQSVRHGVDKTGGNAIINSSRQVLYASNGKDFAEAARRAAIQARDQMREALASRLA